MLIIDDIETYKNKNIILNSIFVSVILKRDNDDKMMCELHLKSGNLYSIDFFFYFTDVIEYYFFFEERDFFKYVERYKFIKTKDDEFYLSLDPYDENLDFPCTKDCLVIRSKNVGREIKLSKEITGFDTLE